jgi:hypothetical protein
MSDTVFISIYFGLSGVLVFAYCLSVFRDPSRLYRWFPFRRRGPVPGPILSLVRISAALGLPIAIFLIFLGVAGLMGWIS